MTATPTAPTPPPLWLASSLLSTRDAELFRGICSQYNKGASCHLDKIQELVEEILRSTQLVEVKALSACAGLFLASQYTPWVISGVCKTFAVAAAYFVFQLWEVRGAISECWDVLKGKHLYENPYPAFTFESSIALPAAITVGSKRVTKGEFLDFIRDIAYKLLAGRCVLPCLRPDELKEIVASAIDSASQGGTHPDEKEGAVGGRCDTARDVNSTGSHLHSTVFHPPSASMEDV